jgi:hypothetical protein
MIAWLKAIREQRAIRDAQVDTSAKCPACGIRREHRLRCIFVEAEQKPNKTVMIEHTCAVCEAKFFEPTVLDPEKWVNKDLLADLNQGAA